MRFINSPAFLAVILATRITLAADTYQPNPTLHPVASLETDWKDPARNVTVPVKIYYPKDLASLQPLPLIIFSHGLGGSREGYQLWGESWAAAGYIVVHPTHVGSDTPALASPLAAINAENVTRRIKDVSFIIDQMEKANAGTLSDKSLAAFKGKIDTQHIGMAGHSFGSETTLAIAGQTLRALPHAADPRVSAAIAMSPQGAVLGNQKAAFASIKIPVLHITGTADASPPGLGDVKPIDRRIPFDNSPFSDTFLLTFQGATHMSFAPTATGTTPGRRLRELRQANDTGTPPNSLAEEEKIHTLTQQSTTAFWDAFLKNTPAAKTWLTTNFAKSLGPAGTFEMKNK